MSERKIVREKIVTTKKDHKCHGCGRFFAKGSTMNSAVCKFNKRSISRKYFCESCHHTMVTKNITVDSFWYGDLLCEAIKYEKFKRNK